MDDMDPNFNQMIFRYGSIWFPLKIHPKWLFNEGFRGPRGVDGFGQFFLSQTDICQWETTPSTVKLLRSPDTCLKNPWIALKTRVFSMFFPPLGGMVRFPCWWLHDIWYQLKASSWKSLHHSSPAPDVQSGMNHVEPLDFSVQQVGRIGVFSSSLNQLWNDAKWNFIWLYVALDLFSGQMFVFC